MSRFKVKATVSAMRAVEMVIQRSSSPLRVRERGGGGGGYAGIGGRRL
jgi:hypothetical protein